MRAPTSGPCPRTPNQLRHAQFLAEHRQICVCATADDDDDEMLAFSLDEIETVSLYAEEAPPTVSGVEAEAQRLLENMSNSVQNAETTNQLLTPAQLRHSCAPSIVSQPYGRDSNPANAPRRQTNGIAGKRRPNHQRFTRSSIEVRSPLGPVLRTRYDEQGHLRFFVRTDKEGNIQSYGESDKQGVVGPRSGSAECVQPENLWRSTGWEDCPSSAKTGNSGASTWRADCTSSADRLVDEDGQWTAITAVFAYDGFRMVTRFRTMEAREFDEEEGCYLPTSGSICKEEIRLYGRDGSCVQIDLEDAIDELRPARVWPPASRAVDKQVSQSLASRNRLASRSRVSRIAEVRSG